MTEAIPYNPDDPAWIEARRHFLGASDVPAVLGLSRFKTALDVWAEKVGLIVAQPGGSLATRLGHELEDMIARLWLEDHPDATVTHNPVTVRHPTRPWLAASPDREVNEDGLIECKLVGANMTSEWDDGVPEHVRAQCMTQMAVTGRQWVDVCSLHAGRRWEHRIERIERDEQALDAMLGTLERWWFDFVVTGQRPGLDGDPDQVRKTLNQLHPGGPVSTVMLPRAVADEIDTLRRAKEMQRDLTKQIGAMENVLIAMLGDDTDGLIDPDQPPIVTYRPTSRTTHDLKAIQAGTVPGFTPDEIAATRRVLDAVARTTTYRTLRIR